MKVTWPRGHVGILMLVACLLLSDHQEYDRLRERRERERGGWRAWAEEEAMEEEAMEEQQPQ